MKKNAVPASLLKSGKPSFLQNLASEVISSEPAGEFAIAHEYHDLVSAGELCYGPAVAKGLIEPNPSRIFFDFYSLLPNHHTFVLRQDSQLVGSVSLVIDSSAGLPSDLQNGAVNRSLRIENRVLAELRAFTVVGTPEQCELRRKKILMAVMLYSSRVAHCQLLNLVITQGEQEFYKSFLQECSAGYFLRTCGEEQNQLLTIDLSSVYQRESPRDEKQSKRSALLVPPVLTYEILNTLLHGRHQLAAQLTPDQWSLLKSAYEPYFDLSPLSPENLHDSAQRAFRFMSHFRAILRTPSRMVLGEVFDISSTGVFFRTKESLDVGSTIQLYFQIHGQTWSIPMKVRRGQIAFQSRYPAGYGLEVEARDGSLLALLRQAHFAEYSVTA